MSRRKLYPWEGWTVGAVVLRFLMSAFFGVLVGVGVFVSNLYLAPDEWFAPAVFVGILIGIPVAWGILGIFFFEEATSIFKGD